MKNSKVNSSLSADQLEERDQAYYAALSHCKVGGDPCSRCSAIGFKAIEIRGIDGILLVEYGRQLVLAGKKDSSVKMDQAGFEVCSGPQRTYGSSGRVLSPGAGEARTSLRYPSPIGRPT
jgi:hypothetical protein